MQAIVIAVSKRIALTVVRSITMVGNGAASIVFIDAAIRQWIAKPRGPLFVKTSGS